jgi:hypothetical protein
MGPVYGETHFKGRQRSVAELFFQHCIDAGVRHADVKEARLGRISKAVDGPILVDGTALDDEVLCGVLLVTPVDRSGWCVAYGSDERVGQGLVDLLGRPCPIEGGTKTWEAYLGIDVAIHGFLNQETHKRGWVLRRGGERTGVSLVEVADAPPGKDLSDAFADVGRLFGSVNLDLSLHRLLNVARPADLDRHMLLWAERPTSSA